MFDTQVGEIQSTYGIEPGGVDLSCFPLFALFNSAMGVTTVLPEMDFSRPASADPKKLLAAANDWQVTQAFASPAVWRVLGEHCAKTGERIESLRQIFSCGAPVPAGVLRSTLAMAAPNAQMHTPYGATECLPVATIEAAEVLGETAARTDQGAGVCVGRKFDSIEWRVIRITDDPIAHDRRCGRIAARRNRRADRPRPAGIAALRDADGVQRGGEDSHSKQRSSPRTGARTRSLGHRCLGTAWATSAISTTRAASGTAAASRSGWKHATGHCSPSKLRRSSTHIRVCDTRPSLVLGPKECSCLWWLFEPMDQVRGGAHDVGEAASKRIASINWYEIEPKLETNLVRGTWIRACCVAVLISSGTPGRRSPQRQDQPRATGRLGRDTASRSLRLMHALVTGAGGFLGRYIVEALVGPRRPGARLGARASIPN